MKFILITAIPGGAARLRNEYHYDLLFSHCIRDRENESAFTRQVRSAVYVQHVRVPSAMRFGDLVFHHAGDERQHSAANRGYDR